MVIIIIMVTIMSGRVLNYLSNNNVDPDLSSVTDGEITYTQWLTEAGKVVAGRYV